MKVPVITGWFWAVKLLSTAMGEATSDYWVHRINPYLAVILGGVGLGVALAWQLRTPRYIAGVYWLAVVMVAVFGTMAADASHIVLGIPYWVTSLAFAVALLIAFVAWYRVEGTLSIHSIYTRRRELFYWAAILAAFALGTATGDMTAVTFHLGYFASAVFFAALFAAPWWCRRLGSNEILAFWFAYVMTRPLGASFADWFGMPASVGGLGYGKGSVAIVLTACIVIVVGCLSVSKIDVA